MMHIGWVVNFGTANSIPGLWIAKLPTVANRFIVISSIRGKAIQKLMPCAHILAMGLGSRGAHLLNFRPELSPNLFALRFGRFRSRFDAAAHRCPQRFFLGFRFHFRVVLKTVVEI